MRFPKQRNAALPMVACAALPFAGIAQQKFEPYHQSGLQIQEKNVRNPQDIVLSNLSGALGDAGDANDTEIDSTDFAATVDTPSLPLQG